MRRTTLAAGSVVLVLALGACSGGGGLGPVAGPDKAGKTSLFSDPLELVAAAKAGTAKGKSSNFSMETNMLGQSIKATGQGRYDGDNTAMSMKMDMMGQTMEMIFIDKALYLKLPDSQRAQTGATKPWVKISADGNDPMSKSLAPMLKTAKDNNPVETLDKISKAGTITKSEQVELDGEQASHYVIDLDFAKLLDQFAADIPGGLAGGATDKLKGKDLRIPAELWLNSDQLPMQMTMDLGKLMAASGAPTNGEAKTVVKYTQWGLPVDIKAPSEDQVGPFGK